MENMSPFETQRRSDWFQDMLTVAENGFGHRDRSWPMRGMLAFKTAGIEGQTLTGNEIVHELKPYIGDVPDRHALNNMVRRAQNRGILKPTGTKRRSVLARNAYPEYEIVGHLEIDIDRGKPVTVGLCGR